MSWDGKVTIHAYEATDEQLERERDKSLQWARLCRSSNPLGQFETHSARAGAIDAVLSRRKRFPSPP